MSKSLIQNIFIIAIKEFNFSILFKVENFEVFELKTTNPIDFKFENN